MGLVLVLSACMKVTLLYSLVFFFFLDSLFFFFLLVPHALGFVVASSLNKYKYIYIYRSVDAYEHICNKYK